MGGGLQNEFQGIQELQDVSMGYRLVRVKKIGIICVIRVGKAILTYIKIGRYPIGIKMDLENCISGCKLRLNGTPVPLLRNGYSIFNGTKYR